MNSKRKYALASAFFIVAAVAILVWVLFGHPADEKRMWHMLLVNYLFFNSLAAGLVVWPAVVTAAYGKWMGITERICWTGLTFAVPSVITLVILWIGSGNWVPWKIPYQHAEWWVDNTFIFTRNLVAQSLFWIAAFVLFSRRNKQNFRKSSYWLILIYALSFSLLGFDFVMILDREWYSMMMGGYFFISGLYIAMAAWAFLSIVIYRPDRKILHDQGKLLIAFCMLTTYLMFSQLFPIWYENIPHEAGFLVPRMNLAWKNVSRFLIIVIYLGPIAALLSSRVKKNYYSLGIISFIILSGLWIERWWLVASVFQKNEILFGWNEILSTTGYLGLTVAGIFLSLPYITRLFKQDEMIK